MGSILKLPCVRFVRQVSNGAALSKYGYIGMMEKNAEAIKYAPWRKAACSVAEVALTVNKVSETDGEYDSAAGAWLKRPTFTAFLKDNYDCFKQGGDALKETGTFCGYAGMVAYRFTLPTVNPGAIDEMKLLIQRDRYLRSGVRVAVEINGDAEPSADWATIRGEREDSVATPSSPSGGALGSASWGFLNQSEVPWLLASRPGEDTLVFSRTEFASLERAADSAYLWVYLSLEDYADYWELYDSKEQRYYSIEGSAALLATCCTFSFETDAVAPESAEESAADGGLAECRSLATPPEIDPELRGSFDGLRCCGGCFVPLRSSGQDLMARLRADGDACNLGIHAGALGVLYSHSNIPLAATNRFGAMWLGQGANASWPSVWDRLFVYCAVSGGSYAHKITAGADGSFQCNFGARLVMGCKVLHVPPDRKSYRKLRVRFRKTVNLTDGSSRAVGIIRHGLPGLRFNVWKSKSIDLHTHNWRAAATALASQGAFYTAESKSISGSFAGTGGVSEGVTVSASAEFVTDFAFEKLPCIDDGDAWLHELDVDCEAGDVLIISPRPDTIVPGKMWRFVSTDEIGACWYYGARASIEHPSAAIPEDSAIEPDYVVSTTDDWSFV